MHDDYKPTTSSASSDCPATTSRSAPALLYVNGQPANRRPMGEILATDENGASIAEKEYTETLPGGPSHLIAKMGDDGFQNNTQEFVVPEGNLFAMGDNRDNSLDSRFMDGRGVGFLPVENLVGRAEFIFFSIDASAPWWQVWQWPLEIRWGRILTGIH